jgi:rhamnosyltransferase
MKERTGCGIVTYNPDIERLEDNIQAISFQVQEIVLFDNGSVNVSDIKSLCHKYPIIRVICNKDNVGIAKALNNIMRYFDEKNYKWVVTLDQDSISPPNLIRELGQYAEEKIGAVGPFINDVNKPVKPYVNNDKFIECNRIITSGCLTNVKAWKDIDGFDEKMFIDGVDFDFCDRVRKAGYRILQVLSVNLTHEIGHIKTHRFLFWNIAVKNHSAFRKYYIAKNIVYLDWKNNDRYFPIKAVLRVLKQGILVAFFEDDKINKLKAIFRGSRDGFRICHGDVE